jgi:hypothetical protein
MPTTTATDDRTPIPNLPPLNWKREIPKYRISRETLPAPKSRVKYEPPFASCSEANIWQYGERIHKAGEVIATTEWPCPGTMTPLNYSAREVMEFYTSRQRSRMARAPWRDDQVFLDDGLSGAMPRIAPPQMQPVGVQPAGGWPRR